MSFKNADKKYVDRHTDQSKATADRLERGAERVTRREGKQEIAAQTPMLNAKIQFDDNGPDEEGRRHFTLTWTATGGVWRPEPSKVDGKPVGMRRGQCFFSTQWEKFIADGAEVIS